MTCVRTCVGIYVGTCAGTCVVTCVRTCMGTCARTCRRDLQGDLSGDLSRNKCGDLRSNLYWRSKEVLGGHKRPHRRFQEVPGTLGHFWRNLAAPIVQFGHVLIKFLVTFLNTIHEYYLEPYYLEADLSIANLMNNLT